MLAFRFHLLTNIWAGTSETFYNRVFGITLLEWRVISAVGALGTLSLKTLGRAAEIDKSHASRTVQKLVDGKLMRKEVDPSDGRAIKLTLTPEGKKLYSKALAKASQRNEEWLAILSAEQRKLLFLMLDQLAEKARDLARQERERSHNW